LLLKKKRKKKWKKADMNRSLLIENGESHTELTQLNESP